MMLGEKFLREHAESMGATKFFAIIYAYDNEEGDEHEFTDFDITLEQIIEIDKIQD